MKRRDFLKSTAAVSGSALTGLASADAQSTDSRGSAQGRQPNILFILVDELSYPTVFPGDIKTPGEFLATYMPNLHEYVWQKGVKFGNYHTAANACTPSRGVIITGLYSQQNWLLNTILSTPYPPGTSQPQPVLNPLYPTYGKLLQASGCQTPYVGKWHVSVPDSTPSALDQYGFAYYKSYYDPTGDNLQGTYGDRSRDYHNDEYTASRAIEWLTKERPTNQPWCLTVGLVNPHDREFFPAGTEFKTYNDLFADHDVNPRNLQQISKYPGNGPVVSWEKNKLKSPDSYGYPVLPPNWEDTDSIKQNKPKTQTFVREFQQGVWGGITDDASQNTASIERYPSPRPLLDFGVVKMPYSYWQRGLDSYTQIMQIVDGQIGRILEQVRELPPDVRDNTVIVFASDHGEYSGAHGFVQGKLATVYEEAWHIPLIVVDPTGRITGDIGSIRHGLTSSVDLSTMLVSIGNNGSRDWMMQGNLEEIYGARHDMIAMLKSANAPGREYVLYATDEVVPNYYNFNKAPTHVLGLRYQHTKLGLYAKWIPLTSDLIGRSIDLEFYDHTTPRGKLELDNTADSDARAQAMMQRLLYDLVPNQMQQRLPGGLGVAQQLSKTAHLLFREFLALQPAKVWQNGGLQKILGYGRMF